MMEIDCQNGDVLERVFHLQEKRQRNLSKFSARSGFGKIR
jgi:hypothetical protein